MNESRTYFLTQINACSTEEEKLLLLNKIALENFRLDTSFSIELSNQAVDLSKKMKNEKGLIAATLTLSKCILLVGDFASAISYLDSIYHELSNSNYKKEKAESLRVFGAIHSGMNKLEEAISYFKKSLEIQKNINDVNGTISCLNSIGDALMKQNKYNEALEHFILAQQLKSEDKVINGIVLYNVAETFFYLNRIEESIKNIEACRIIGNELNFPLMKIYCDSLYAKIYLKNNNVEKAIALLKSCLKIAEDKNNKERTMAILHELSIAFEKLGNINEAFDYFKKFHDLQNAVMSSESKEKLKAIEFKNELELAKKETQVERTRIIQLEQAYSEIESLKNSLTEKNNDVANSIKYAKRIQSAMLVQTEEVYNLFKDHFILFLPKDILSGDFYWAAQAVTKYNENIVMAAIADCTGHGVPGALMSIIGNNFLRLCENDPLINRPSEALDFINKGISNTLRQEYSKSKIRDGMDMVFIAVDYSNGLLHFAGAKNPLYIIRKEELLVFKGDRHPIGAFEGEEIKQFTNHTIPIFKGDKIYLFTDGFPDQFGGEYGKKFGYKKFRETLLSISKLSMSKQLKKLEQTFNLWKKDLDQIDDVCVMGIEI